METHYQTGVRILAATGDRILDVRPKCSWIRLQKNVLVYRSITGHLHQETGAFPIHRTRSPWSASSIPYRINGSEYVNIKGGLGAKSCDRVAPHAMSNEDDNCVGIATADGFYHVSDIKLELEVLRRGCFVLDKIKYRDKAEPIPTRKIPRF